MAKVADRQTVDLSSYPDLIVIYLGMRVNAFRGFTTLLGFGSKISNAVKEKPDGLLLHESVVYSLKHVGMRQYWRDFDSLERWARSDPHSVWWQTFIRDTGGTGFWHETYFVQGGMESIYIDMKKPVGFMRFAPTSQARGAMFTARRRLHPPGEETLPPGFTEEELYSSERSAG